MYTISKHANHFINTSDRERHQRICLIRTYIAKGMTQLLSTLSACAKEGYSSRKVEEDIVGFRLIVIAPTSCGAEVLCNLDSCKDADFAYFSVVAAVTGRRRLRQREEIICVGHIALRNIAFTRNGVLEWWRAGGGGLRDDPISTQRHFTGI